jgi:electron transport complex protein RnfG
VDELTPAEFPAHHEPGALTISTRTAIILAIFSVAFTALMAVTYQMTRTTIAASAEAEKMKLIGEVLPAAVYDNELLKDWLELPPAAAIGNEVATRLYRARKNGRPAAIVMEAAATDGYSGRIGLLLAIRASGELIAVRVTGHRETPGLGDYIDPKKDKNKARPWIGQFDDIGFAQVPPGQWKVRKDGGHFEQRAGATISARAVTNAVGRALRFANDNSERIYAAPAQSRLPGE